MARRSWDSLSPGYRSRLVKNGVTRHKYESGENLGKARGHAKTPEHPDRVKPEHTEYIARKEASFRRLTQTRTEAWGGRPKWNAAKENKSSPPPGTSIEKIRRANNQLREYIDGDIDLSDIDEDLWHLIGYHKE